jgi:hypothetical protein
MEIHAHVHVCVHEEFASCYSTNSFLMALQRFMCLRRISSRIQSDRAEQLVDASKQLQAWDFKEIIDWLKVKFRMALIPTGVQHFNVQVEQMIGFLKKQMQRSL